MVTEANLRDTLHRLGKTDVWALLTALGDFLAGQHIDSYIVGGWMRDTLLGRDTADIDIAVASDALKVGSAVATFLGGKYVPLDEVNGVARVILPGDRATPQRQLDFSTLQDSIEQDLTRRDFTVNAMAISLEGLGSPELKLIDPLLGREDLQRRIIRVVAVTAFAADAVRLLRAVRLAAELGFTIEKQTEALIRRDSLLISSVAGERAREELLRLLAAPGGEFLNYLDELGLLTAIIPELAPTKGVEQPKEHHWDVFQHSLRAVTAVDFLLRRGNWEYASKEALALVPWSKALAEHFDREVSSGSTRRSMLKLAALLHDICKPQTKAIDTAGRTRFLGHAQEGVALVTKIMGRLRFSSKEVKLVETEVEYHLRPMQMSQSGLPTDRAIYRYFRDTAEAGIEVLFLSLADHLAARGPGLDPVSWQEHTRLTSYVIAKRYEQQIVRLPKLVDGYDIINILAVAPGPGVGEALEAVHEAQAAGEITTREEALSFIKGLKKNA